MLPGREAKLRHQCIRIFFQRERLEGAQRERGGGVHLLLAQLPKGCLCVELASIQGIDLAAAEELGLPHVWARSLPGRMVPAAAAVAIRDAVDYILKERGDPV